MRVLVFLLLYSLSFAGLPEIITTMCPRTFTVMKTLNGCEDVCREVKKRGSLHDRPIIGVIGPKEFGVQNGITYFDNTCTCAFASGLRNGVITDYIYCSYKVEHKALEAKRLQLKGPESLGDTDIPTNLVKMFIFDKQASGTSAGDVIFSGLYTVYTQAIKGFSIAFALALTIIVAGWTFGTYFFTNFIQVLRSRHGHLEFAISSDLKSKAMAVLLVSMVFLVPLNTNSFILEKAGVGYSDKAKERLIQGCNAEPIGNINNVAECREVPPQYNCPVCQDYLTQIANNCREILQKEQEPDDDTGIDKRVYISHLKNQNLLLAEGYNMCVKTFNERQKKNQDEQANNYEKYPRWLRPESIQKDIETTYLPTAVAVVKSFISTGLGFAQGVGAFAGDVIQAYVIKKLSGGESYKALGMPSMKEQQDQVKQMIKELEKKETINADLSYCNLPITKCSEFRQLDITILYGRKHENAYCGTIIESVANYCSKIDLDAITSMKDTLQKALDSAKNEQQLLTERTAQAFNSIRDSMTWLSPAVIPLVSIYVQVAKFAGVKNDPPQTTVILVGSSKPKNLDWIGATFRAGEEALDKVGDAIKGLGSALFSGPVSNIAGETKDVGWDALVKGAYGSRAFFIGRVFGLTSIPPGSIIKNGLNTLAGAAGNILGFIGVAGVTASAFLMGLVPATLLGLALFAIGKVTGIATTIIITLASAVITAMLLNAIPLLAVAIVVIFRFLAYLKDLIKYMLSLPFFAVAAATKDAGGVFEAFRELIKLTLMPAVIAFTPLVGFAAVELTMFFGYDLPMTLLDSAIKTFAGDNILFLFVTGYFTGVLYVIVTFLSALVGWEISLAFTDSITEFIHRVAGGTASASSRAIASALAILRPAPRA